MQLPPITSLRADIVPHRQWAVSKWFYANPLWYYHRPGTDEEIIANRRFYQLVDPDLRDLCHLLNDAGLHTTPSCQGHFYPRQRFEQIWTELNREHALITQTGLPVRDSETDKEYLFQDPAYSLPWPDFESFYAQAAAHQDTGYLGILIPLSRPDLFRAFRSTPFNSDTVAMAFDDTLSHELGGHLFTILLHARNPEHRTHQWAAITQWVRSLLAPKIFVLRPDDPLRYPTTPCDLPLRLLSLCTP